MRRVVPKSFRRAALLLEVVVALAIMVAAMGVLGATGGRPGDDLGF